MEAAPSVTFPAPQIAPISAAVAVRAPALRAILRSTRPAGGAASRQVPPAVPTDHTYRWTFSGGRAPAVTASKLPSTAGPLVFRILAAGSPDARTAAPQQGTALLAGAAGSSPFIEAYLQVTGQ